jgi:hypothetical protein
MEARVWTLIQNGSAPPVIGRGLQPFRLYRRLERCARPRADSGHLGILAPARSLCDLGADRPTAPETMLL